MLERPLLLPLLSIIAGVASAASFSIYVPGELAVILLVLAVPALVPKSRIPFSIILSLLFLIWGNLSVEPYLRPQFPPGHISGFAGDDPVVIEGIITERPQPADGGCRMQITTEKICRRDGYIPVTGKLLLFIAEGRTPLVTGDRVRFSSRLSRPRNNLIPGAYDYVRHLSLQGIHTVGFVEKQEDVILMLQGVSQPVAGWLDHLAARAGSFISSVAPPVEAAVLRALLLGEQGGVSPELTDAYARSGVSHILSISGFHMGIISLVVFQLLYRAVSRVPFLLLHCNARRSILLLTLPVMIFYLFLCGSAPATLRSVIMLGAFILALALERETDSVDSLLLAAFLILLLTPGALFDISFQLSFLALWGLLVLTPWFMTPFASVGKPVLRKALYFAMASAAATVATAIPVAHYFHKVSFTGLLANFLIVPLLGYGAVVLGFLSLPFIPSVPVVAEWLLMVATFLVWLSNGIIDFFARIPVATFLQPRWPSLGLFFLFAVVFTFTRGARIRAVGCSLCLVSLAGSLIGFPVHRDRLQITFFSIGQGESTLVRFPNGKTMLIDGGGLPSWGNGRRSVKDVGERLLAPALWYQGIRRIDILVLTHPHPDHLQGLLYIAANFPVGELWEGVAPGEGEEYHQFKRILAEKGVPVRQIGPGDQAVQVGEARIVFPGLPAPEPGSSKSDENVNDQSLVFRLALNSFSVLFTGDIGTDAEERLLTASEDLHCTILKVPHHGSRHSSSPAFLAATSPQEAVISAGYKNVFHLPAAETLQRLKKCGARVWRTDEDGTITVTAERDGAWRIASFSGQIR